MALERLAGFAPCIKVVSSDVGEALRVGRVRIESHHRDVLLCRAGNHPNDRIGIDGRNGKAADAARQQVSQDLDLFGFIRLRRPGVKNLPANLFASSLAPLSTSA